MSLAHAVLWLDENDALIAHLDWQSAETRLMPRAGRGVDAWYDALASALADAEEILVTGDGNAPHAFATWVQHVSPAQRARIFDVQRLIRPGAQALVDHARRYFADVDRPHHLTGGDALIA